MRTRLTIAFVVFYSAFGIGALAQKEGGEGDRLDVKLLELHRSVGDSNVREIRFEERRFFPFRKQPVELEGVLRLWNGVGVSIHYPEKRALVIADQEGVLLRRFSQNGSFQQKKAGRGEGDTVSLLRAAFAFDREELRRLFDLDLIENDEEWTLVMVPADEKEKSIRSVSISGLSLGVQKILMEFGESRSIEIRPTSEERKEAFSSEERTRYFRDAGE